VQGVNDFDDDVLLALAQHPEGASALDLLPHVVAARGPRVRESEVENALFSLDECGFAVQIDGGARRRRPPSAADPGGRRRWSLVEAGQAAVASVNAGSDANR
jgi:hypothetical protein